MTSTSSSKKRRGSLSKKEKSSRQLLPPSSSTSPYRILFLVFLFWIVLCLVGFFLYLKKERRDQKNQIPLSDQEKKTRRQQQQQKESSRPAFLDEYNTADERTVKTKIDDESAAAAAAAAAQSTINEEQLWEPPDPRIAAFFTQACQEIYCHESLRVVGRTIRATGPIEKGVKLFEIPRSMQIWDLDAYRDPFIRRLFKASHKISGNRMGTEAFLAAYLALEMKKAEQNPSNFDPLRIAYFDMLPTLEEFIDYHPILVDKNLMNDILGRSTSRSILNGYRFMISSEYDGFSSISSDFAKAISKDEYIRARLNVLTRKLNVGPPGPEEVMAASFVGDEFRDENLFLDELYSYYDLINVNLTEAGGTGCIALVPIADLFNHHPNNNINLQYQRMQNKTGRSFVVSSANRAIEPYSEPMASYGVLADSHLFARYGFVNGDGSGPIQLSLAFYHEMMKLNISNQYDYLPDTGATPKFRSYQKRGLAKYINFDDGYAQCNSGPSTHPDEAELKRLKLQHLIIIANDYDKWNILAEPRNPNSLPAKTIDDPITLMVPQLEKNYTILTGLDRLRETCRLISLINDDFDGKAIQVLTDNIDNPNFSIGPNVSDALEFRSYMCITRIFGTRVATMELQGNLESEYRRVSKMNRNEFGSKNWTAYHVRFSEMQALQAGSGFLFERLSQNWESKKVNAAAPYTMRDTSCPEEYLNYLFRDDELVPDILDLR